MKNPYIPKIARIKKIFQETPDIKRFVFQFKNPKERKDFSFRHGQFMNLGVLGFGEAPFDICSSTADTRIFELAVRKAGSLTEKIHELRVGDAVTVRGPFGNGLPERVYKDKELLLIGGGCGFIVMRSFVLDYLAGRLPANKLNVFYGCLNEDNLIFQKEYPAWRKKIGLDLVLDRPSPKWKGPKGVVTLLFNDQQDFTDTVALVVGPPVMYKFVIKELQKRNMADENIFVSLERRMHCGVGVCQHCAVGPYYVCKDGPVFSWAQLKDIPGAI